GFRYAKVGANYGPSLMANAEARARGCDQVLWLLDVMVTEAGASNFFVVWRSQDRMQLVTAPSENKIILDGVTIRSILQLSRERLYEGTPGLETIEIVERNFTMDDIDQTIEDGRMIEAFVAETAIPMVRGDSGEYATLIKSWLVSIMYGKEDHEWGVVIDEKVYF
ncbi:hypothetical protein B7494_g7933, partial [Chlorociboria aeruginascens]